MALAHPSCLIALLPRFLAGKLDLVPHGVREKGGKQSCCGSCSRV